MTMLHESGSCPSIVPKVLAGVWSMPPAVRQSPIESGLGDRIEGLIQAATLVKLGLFERVVVHWVDGSHRYTERGRTWNISAVPYPRPIFDHIRFPPELHFVSSEDFYNSSYASLPLVSSCIDCHGHVSAPPMFPAHAVASFCKRAQQDISKHRCARPGLTDPAVCMVKHPTALAFLIKELWPLSHSVSFDEAGVAAAVRCAHLAASREVTLVSPQAARLPKQPFGAIHIRRGERGLARCGLRESSSLCQAMHHHVAEADARLFAFVGWMMQQAEFKGERWYIASDDMNLVRNVTARVSSTVELADRNAQRTEDADNQGMEDLLEFFALSRAHVLVANYVARETPFCGELQFPWHHSEYTFGAAYLGPRTRLMIPAPRCCTKAHYLNAYADLLNLPASEHVVLLDEKTGAVQPSASHMFPNMHSDDGSEQLGTRLVRKYWYEHAAEVNLSIGS